MNLTLPKYGDTLTSLRSQPSGSTSVSSTPLLNGSPIRLSLSHASVSTGLPLSYTRTLFGRLADTIRATLPTERPGHECMSIAEAYHACRTLVRTMGMGEDVYRVLSEQLGQYTIGMLSKLNASKKSLAEWLDLLANEWESFDHKLRTLQCMLAEVDQTYVPSRSGLDSIYTQGLTSFGDVVMTEPIASKLQDGVVEWLNQERLNEQPNHRQRESIVTLRNCLISLKLYGDLLEEPYLIATTAYWTDEGAVQRNADDFSAAAYIKSCIQHIKVEQDRARAVLRPGGWESVGKVTEQALLENDALSLASRALITLMLMQDKDGLADICRLYRHAGFASVFRAAFKEILGDNVREIVMAGAEATTGKRARTSKARSRGKAEDVHPDEKIVPSLVTLRHFVKQAIKDSFGEVTRGEFSSALDDAFAMGVSARDYVPSAMMAQALDREMRRGQRGESDEGWRSKLFDILELSKYTREKDVFREIYTRALAKRLLTRSTTDDDMEKALIAKLKSDYDPEFSAGGIMFKDLQQSVSDMEEYRRGGKDPATKADRSLNVMVLTHAKWPSFKEHNMLASDDSATVMHQKRGRKDETSTIPVVLPPEMAAALYRFQQYYKGKHKNRRVAWFHSLGTVVLSSRFDQGEKELSVSMYQALVLLLFNEQDQLSAAEIQSRTKLSDSDVEITLQSLALGKKRVLTRANPKSTKDIAMTDEFRWNGKFTDIKRNVHIQSIQQQTTMEETQQAEEGIIENRPYLIDAAIVRIMKAKKTRTYEQIKAETIEALQKHFQPTVTDIKKRIDHLQQDEYIERDPGDKNVFRYV